MNDLSNLHFLFSVRIPYAFTFDLENITISGDIRLSYDSEMTEKMCFNVSFQCSCSVDFSIITESHLRVKLPWSLPFSSTFCNQRVNHLNLLQRYNEENITMFWRWILD